MLYLRSDLNLKARRDFGMTTELIKANDIINHCRILNNLFSHEPGKNNCNHSCEALLQYIQATSEAMAQVGLKCLERKVLFAALKRYANSLYKERKVQYDYKQSEYIKLEQENYDFEVHHPKADETAKIMIEEMQQINDLCQNLINFDLPSHFEDHTADLLRQQEGNARHRHQ